MNSYFWLNTLGLSLLILLTRTLPFMLAHLMGENFIKVGKELPAYIMLLLVIYEINPKTFHAFPYGLPALISLGLLLVMHLWRRNTFLSLATGTMSYLVITHGLY